MSDDLVSRLRVNIFRYAHESEDDAARRRIATDLEAATAIEEARAEIERLRSFEKAKAQEETCDTFGEIGFVGIRDYAAMQARAEKAESVLSTLRDMLVLCGELGGMGKDETPTAYLRRLIDEVAGVESLRARVREVVGPFAAEADGTRLCGAEFGDDWKPFLHRSYTEVDITNGHLRAARQLMEEVK